jgi:hypothetical protein
MQLWRSRAGWCDRCRRVEEGEIVAGDEENYNLEACPCPQDTCRAALARTKGPVVDSHHHAKQTKGKHETTPALQTIRSVQARDTHSVI